MTHSGFILLDENGRVVLTDSCSPDTALPPGLYEVVWEGERKEVIFRHHQGNSILDEIAGVMDS